MHLMCPRSRISPLRCDVWPAITVLPEKWGVGNVVAQRLPAESQARLIAHRQMGHVAPVNEDVRLGLVIIDAPLKNRRCSAGTTLRSCRFGTAIGGQGCGPAHTQEGAGMKTIARLENMSSWLPRIGTSRH